MAAPSLNTRSDATLVSPVTPAGLNVNLAKVQALLNALQEYAVKSGITLPPAAASSAGDKGLRGRRAKASGRGGPAGGSASGSEG